MDRPTVFELVVDCATRALRGRLGIGLLAFFFAELGSPVLKPHLNTGLGEIDFNCDFLSRVNVRIMGLAKSTLKLFELCVRERGPDAALFTLFAR